MIMFFIFAISKCLFEKNLANKIISTSFIGSDGPKKKDPKLNQRAPPFAICPKTNIKLRKLIKNINEHVVDDLNSRLSSKSEFLRS